MLYRSRSFALFTCLLLLLSASLVSGFLQRGSSAYYVSFNAVNTAEKAQINNTKDSNDDYFGLLTFGMLLTNYNFSTIWFNHSERSGTGMTENKCVKIPVEEEKPTSIHCSLTTASSSKGGNTSQALNLYLNESDSFDFDSSNSIE